MTIDHPTALISLLSSKLPPIQEHLKKLDAGFSFGYDIFPDGQQLDNPDNLGIFSGISLILNHLNTEVHAKCYGWSTKVVRQSAKS
jgi:hypothetical protein